MAGSAAEVEKLRKALQWLESHRKRLLLDRRSLESQVAGLSTEIDRLGREIEGAQNRLRDLAEG